MYKLMQSKELTNKIYSQLKSEISKNKLQLNIAVILIGHDINSEVYVKIKQKKAQELGIGFTLHKYDQDAITQIELLKLIEQLNNDKTITGILVQFPLPDGFDIYEVSKAIIPSKDIDRVNPYSIGETFWNKGNSHACTADGIIDILKEYKVSIKNKHVVIVGDSMIVGKPLAALILNEGGTVSVLNKNVSNLKQITKTADILVTATGVKHLIGPDHVKDDVVIIDAGITNENGKIFGDCDLESLLPKVKLITPPIGGIGPLTVSSLMRNIVRLNNNEK